MIQADISIKSSKAYERRAPGSGVTFDVVCRTTAERAHPIPMRRTHWNIPMLNAVRSVRDFSPSRKPRLREFKLWVALTSMVHTNAKRPANCPQYGWNGGSAIAQAFSSHAGNLQNFSSELTAATLPFSLGGMNSRSAILPGTEPDRHDSFNMTESRVTKRVTDPS